MRFALLSIALALGCGSLKPVCETGFLNRSVTLDSTTYRYVVYIPDKYDRLDRWPVVLFLHGSGERGDDGWRQTQVGLGAAIRWNPERFGEFIVVFPQAPADTRWLEGPADAAMLALDRTIAEFRGDESRVYLTGVSLGGYGTWHLAVEHSHRFAALVPVCGGVVAPLLARNVRQLPITVGSSDPYATAAVALPRIPVWIFHGTDDGLIPVTESRRMHEELKKLGFDVRYTEYPGVGHNSWDPAYAELELWTWLLQQRR